MCSQNIESSSMEQKKATTDRFAIWGVEGGVLPHCETVRLVSTLGNQVVF